MAGMSVSHGGLWRCGTWTGVACAWDLDVGSLFET